MFLKSFLLAALVSSTLVTVSTFGAVAAESAPTAPTALTALSDEAKAGESMFGLWRGPMVIGNSTINIELLLEDKTPLAGYIKMNVATSGSQIPLRNIEADGNQVAFELNASPANFVFIGALADGILSGDVSILDKAGTFRLTPADTPAN